MLPHDNIIFPCCYLFLFIIFPHLVLVYACYRTPLPRVRLSKRQVPKSWVMSTWEISRISRIQLNCYSRNRRRGGVGHEVNKRRTSGGMGTRAESTCYPRGVDFVLNREYERGRRVQLLQGKQKKMGGFTSKSSGNWLGLL